MSYCIQELVSAISCDVGTCKEDVTDVPDHLSTTSQFRDEALRGWLKDLGWQRWVGRSKYDVCPKCVEKGYPRNKAGKMRRIF